MCRRPNFMTSQTGSRLLRYVKCQRQSSSASWLSSWYRGDLMSNLYTFRSNRKRLLTKVGPFEDTLKAISKNLSKSCRFSEVLECFETKDWVYSHLKNKVLHSWQYVERIFNQHSSELKPYYKYLRLLTQNKRQIINCTKELAVELLRGRTWNVALILLCSAGISSYSTFRT